MSSYVLIAERYQMAERESEILIARTDKFIQDLDTLAARISRVRSAAQLQRQEIMLAETTGRPVPSGIVERADELLADLNDMVQRLGELLTGETAK